MDNEQQGENVTLLYIQKQEQLILEQSRKHVDYEIKLHLLNDKLNQHIEKIKELIQTIETQNNIINQATASIELLTEEKKEIIKKDKTEEFQQELFVLSSENAELKNEINRLQKVNSDYYSELKKQNEELNKLYNLNGSSKKKTKKTLDETF